MATEPTTIFQKWARLSTAVRSAAAAIDSEPKHLASLKPIAEEAMKLLSGKPSSEVLKEVEYLLQRMDSFVSKWRPSLKPTPGIFYIQPQWAASTDREIQEALRLIQEIRLAGFDIPDDQPLEGNPSDLNPWPVIRSFLLRLSSYEVPVIVDRAGLTVDWTLTDEENYSQKTRLAAYRPRIDTAYQCLSSDDDRLRVAHIITQELAKHDSLDVLNDALRKICWEIREDRLVPSGSAIRELFFPDQSQHDAYVEIRAILQRVTNRITIVDPYIDQSILTLLSTCTKPGLSIQILTSRLPSDFALEGGKWLSQHAGSSLEIRTAKEFHDRFIVLDNSACWHIGCSLKDAGNKAFMMSELEDDDNREALLLQITRSWGTATIVL